MSEARPKDGASPGADRTLRVLLPIAVLALGVLLWELVVRAGNIPPYVLPNPWLVFSTLISDRAVLLASLLVTLTTTLEGFLLAAIGGIGLAVLFNQSRLIEYSLYPYAIILQVTPIVAIAPLLLVYLPQPAAVLACAWIVAFFPVLANTTLGLNSVDHNLVDLFRLYGATRLQMLFDLKLPAALPYILGGLKIAYYAWQKSLANKPQPAPVDGFTPEQRFFLSFAQNWRRNTRPEALRLMLQTDPHSPPQWRVNGALQATPEFAKAFSCKAGAKMAPKNACVVW